MDCIISVAQKIDTPFNISFVLETLSLQKIIFSYSDFSG
jgi:hypothetical protein